MKIPNTVKIGGAQYSIEIVDEINGDSEILGELNREECRFRLKKGTNDSINQTFLHELFHAMNVDFDEERVEFLSIILYQVIQDNPTLFGGE